MYDTNRSISTTLLIISVSVFLWVPPAYSAESGHAAHQGHDHNMTPEQFSELREKIELYREMSDDQIVNSMSRMRNLGGMISDADVAGDVGILALAHGYKDEGNRQWMEKFESISQEYPTGYGLGMAMMSADHIQQAIDGLEAAGAKTILVLRTETGDANSLNYQWQYIFGQRDESSYLTIPRVKTTADVIWGPSPTAHPIMADIMLDHARDLSVDPANELVIIMGHGAMTQKENEMDLAIMARHAATIREKGGFSDVKFWNVQDDLPQAKRAKNVEKVRGWISDARAEGLEVIVVTNALTQSGIMGRLEKDVAGTGAKFHDGGLMQNPLFSNWIEAAVAENLPQ